MKTHDTPPNAYLCEYLIYVFVLSFSPRSPSRPHQFCTALGALIVPMVHVTVYDLTESDIAALISSCYILFDVGMVTLNQYILLDPILLCFMTASVMGMVKVSKATHNRQTFTANWWSWLLFTGTMIACTISVKFVGLFVILLVGLHTINDLWIELGDLTKPVVSTLFFTL